MKKILVTGADGMLGSAVKRVFKDFELILTDKAELDVRTYKELINIPVPDYILHLAAETDLEYCEAFPRHAYYTNTIGTFNMTEVARAWNIPIVYMSTAGVFGNEPAEYFDENSKANPVNFYGRSKYYGEWPVRAYEKGYIFRISWAFGGGSLDRKFVMKIYKQIVSGKKEILAVTDKSGSPSYTMDVAKVIKDFIVNEKPYGTYHIPTGEGSRFDVVHAMKQILGSNILVKGVKSSHFGDYSTTRPKCEVLRSVKGVEARPWQEALKEYLNELSRG